MIIVRKAEERGRTQVSWLDSRHTFSFGEYHAPEHMGFRALRVINEDRVQPGGGFARHSHRDMEIITYIIAGALEHKDSMGNGSVITPGEVQRMSAGTGVWHSEANPSKTEPVHFLQIWILPARTGTSPSYEQRAFSPAAIRGKLRLVGAQDDRDDAVNIHQDVELYASTLEPAERIAHDFKPGRYGWVQIIRGQVRLNNVALAAGDGAAVSEEARIELQASESAALLFFDLA